MSEITNDAIKNRYDFSILFDVENGNPNGDPDSGNMPRIDTETGLGLVTDVCLKRKIRNYVQLVDGDKAPNRIYIQQRVPLNRLDDEALDSVGVDTDAANAEKDIKRVKKDDPDLDRKIRDYMCSNFFDIRTFGAVMTTFVKGSLSSGQVRGPVQLGFSRSIDPVIPQEITITRVAITTEADAEKKNNEIGRKYIIPYGLYRANGYISAKLAEQTTGFSDADLELLWNAILNMFEFDRSAARGNMAVRKLYVFKHSNDLGDAPSYKLFDSVKVNRKPEVSAPRTFNDYDVKYDATSVPDSVQVTEKVDGITL
ncbi:type I-C CRISPR-associated protein Cas7/Csd2 [Bifidobacterium sp. ESL0704]|uniref:type I-C CRISPR-associated protein Cas7/Csd2 n=1 Tax=Bifidobacterium sp. ESL0704 TaxID=2983219 RepID=UPI0023F9B84C|nr:type I-C CRISPR-associated protein Cas7/Csd2 [Bifidobacterium sp. ESL0704]WEV53574.1 type I-C CRISPR-associated protein Cas7/Csd2 [Bifidobacterium sp. ESL0704]